MKRGEKPVVALCSSASFYKQLVGVAEELEREDLAVILPRSARRMKESGDFSLQYQSWRTNDADYPQKAALIRAHFEEIERADAVLVLNYEKRGQANYIGGNVLMEMSLAFYLRKPIFILNEAPADSPFLEEILGMLPVLLHGRLEDFPGELKRTLQTAS